jgi:hypothetical protein
MRVSEYAISTPDGSANILPSAPANVEDIIFVKTHVSILVEQIEKSASVVRHDHHTRLISRISNWKFHDLLMVREAVLKCAAEVMQQSGSPAARVAARELLIEMRATEVTPIMVAALAAALEK